MLLKNSKLYVDTELFISFKGLISLEPNGCSLPTFSS